MSTHEAHKDDLTRQISEHLQALIANAILSNDRIARSLGLNLVDLQTFGLIAGSDHPMTPGAVSALTGLPSSSTTRVLDRLEERGYVERLSDPTDRRKVLVRANRDRLSDTSALYDQVVEGLRRLHDTLSVADLETVASYLAAMAQSTDQLQPGDTQPGEHRSA
jgi:DNA-binding MarR family transcriptional regulator